MGLRTCRDCGLSSDDLNLFKRDRKAPNGRINLCLTCAAKRLRDYRHMKQDLVNDLKRRPCEICGVNFPPCAMDFHHKDGNEKEFGIAEAVGDAKSVTRILQEISKCILVCSNCHRIIHSAEEE